MQVCAYLNFAGNCEEAFKLYEKALGGKIVNMMTQADTPMKDKTPAESLGKIAHVRLQVGDSVLMGSDAPPDHFQPAQGSSVCVQADDVAEAERVFNALSEGGNVQMPLAETFWALRFAMFTDRFGTPWMVNCEKKP